MLSAAVLLPGSAAACLPHRCRQSLSQLPSLASWGLQLPNSISHKATRTAVRAQNVVQDTAVSADNPAQKLPAFLAELQNRQTGRLRSPTVDQQGRIILKNLTKSELADWFEMQGERRQRANHLWRWMYYKDHWVQDLEETHAKQYGFGADFRQSFNAQATLDGGLELQSVHRAADGTCKMLFKLKDQDVAGAIETVLIPVVREGSLKPRTTLCVSSQVGCAMNCQFCFTGRMGLRAQLSTAQIVEQVIEALRLASQESKAAALGLQGAAPLPPLTNIVFMGMGEPLHNLSAVMSAVDILCDNTGLQFSHNKVTVSTVGLVPQLRHFVKNSPAQLAVSLHATTDEVRKRIVPVNRKWPLHTLVAALQDTFPRRVGKSHPRHVLIEYVMLKDVNDTLEDAHRLVELMQPIECKINLIMFNPHQGTRFTASDMNQVEAFRAIIMQVGPTCNIRTPCICS
ncbi:hypothetical protein ABBQ32_011057 [Trebouxia sp. C0010 RCD-2024]